MLRCCGLARGMTETSLQTQTQSGYRELTKEWRKQFEDRALAGVQEDAKHVHYLFQSLHYDAYRLLKLDRFQRYRDQNLRRRGTTEKNHRKLKKKVSLPLAWNPAYSDRLQHELSLCHPVHEEHKTGRCCLPVCLSICPSLCFICWTASNQIVHKQSSPNKRGKACHNVINVGKILTKSLERLFAFLARPAQSERLMRRLCLPVRPNIWSPKQLFGFQ